MTILFITRKFPPSIGGMERFTYDLYGALSKEANVKLIKWGGSNKYLPLILPYLFFSSFLVLIKGDIDIIHGLDGILAPLAYILSRIFRKPFTVVIHGLDITYKNKLFQIIIPKFVSKADKVFCVSQATADELVQRGIKRSIVQVIPLGITDDIHQTKNSVHKKLHDELNLNEDSPILLTIGRLVERKGVVWFIESAMPQLIKEYPDIMYLVVGDGENRTKIKDIVSQNGLENHVKMLGAVSDEMIPMLYNGADVFVQPNIKVAGNIEGFGRVLLEASLCELPVVAANLEGIKDAITNNENGILVESKNAEAFIKEIKRLINDKSKSTKFGVNSRQYTLQKYQWNAIAKEYIKAFKVL